MFQSSFNGAIHGENKGAMALPVGCPGRGNNLVENLWKEMWRKCKSCEKRELRSGLWMEKVKNVVKNVNFTTNLASFVKTWKRTCWTKGQRRRNGEFVPFPTMPGRQYPVADKTYPLHPLAEQATVNAKFNLLKTLILLAAPAIAVAADEAPAVTATETAAPAPSQGLVPVPDYTGDIWNRNRLTGDWGGTRTDLANKGIQFDVTFTQTVQSVVDGGRDSDTRYGGSLDYVLTLDLMRMGVMPGALIKFRGESRYGASANGIAGPLLPVNTDAFFPLGDGLDDDIAFTLTNFTYYQFLSEQFGIFLGKLDTLDSDLNEFASGRGTSQFMNANLAFPTAPLLTVPYATLGAGIIWMPTKSITITSVVMNADDSSTTTGFDDFGEGTTWASEAQFRYQLGTLPGGQNAGFIYGFDNNFLVLGDRFVFQPGQGLVAPTTDETWAAYWSLWQYVFVEQASDVPIDLLNGKQDHQGVGIFLRIGFADDDTSPFDLTVSGGIGARGIIPSRDNDTCGIAFYYTSLESGRLAGIAGIDDKSFGFEAYYNLHVTPAAQLTFDVQVVESAQDSIDTAVVLGLRLNLQF